MVVYAVIFAEDDEAEQPLKAEDHKQHATKLRYAHHEHRDDDEDHAHYQSDHH